MLASAPDPHRSNALVRARYSAAAAFGQWHARVVWPCHCHGLGLVSLRAARERLHSRSAKLSTVPRIPHFCARNPTRKIAVSPSRKSDVKGSP